MNVKHVVVTTAWVVAMLLAWRSGPWSGSHTNDSATSEPHDSMFHMHQPLHANGKVNMVGQFHLELASQSDGTHRLWISNAFRQEMDPAGFEGSLTIGRVEGDEVKARFQRVGRSKELLAQSDSLEGQVWLTVNGKLGQTVRFESVKFFWDYGPQAFEFAIPLGLDRMVPIPADNGPTADKVALGRDLFFDPSLSADGSVSCATCHQPEFAFAEPRTLAQGIEGRVGRRNTPTILNTAYLPSLFWDGRSASLEHQAIEPILNHAEMGFKDGGSLVNAIESKYGQRARDTFGQPLTIETVALAIASYERTLLSGDSDFDRYELGQRDAIDDAAKRGRTLFFGKATCGSCHIPPLFTDFAFHNLGVGWQGADRGDRGRFETTGRHEDLGAFKTPALRDVTKTAPYMHDGSIRSLRGVLEFYNQGGHKNPSLDPLIQPLSLADSEIDDLLAFLKTLEGRPSSNVAFTFSSQSIAAASPVRGLQP